MKKYLVITLLMMFFLLVGCSNNSSESLKNNDLSKEDNYSERLLTIVVVGDQDLGDIENVTFIKKTPEEMLKGNEKYDAVIITKSAFEEVEKDKYVTFYNTVQYPVFFFGLESTKYFAFVYEKVSLEAAHDNTSSYIQGFQNIEDGRKTWEINLPESPSNYDKNEGSINRIIDILEKNK